MKPIVLAMTGASGAIYGVRLLQQCLLANRSVHLVASDAARLVIKQELLLDLPHRSIAQPLACYDLANQSWDVTSHQRWQVGLPSRSQICELIQEHHPKDYMTPIASGSYRTQAMVICPCSGSTLSGIVHAAGQDLIQRAAEVHLKERRKLVVVPRETPLSTFQLDNMHRLASQGGIVMPAAPGWYHGVHCMLDLVDFVVARILDHLEVDHQLMTRWCESTSSSPVPEEPRE